MTQRNLIAPRQGAKERVTELHRQCDEDYIKGQDQRSTPRLSPSYAPALPGPAAEPSDLDVAIRVAKQLLDSDNVLALQESLRLLLRSLGAEPALSPVVDAGVHTPVGPGCGAPATVRFEGYSTHNGSIYGSLDLDVYACEDHAGQARTEWMGGLLPYRTATAGTARCGESFDFTKLGGVQ